MRYRSNKHDVDADALIFIGFITLSVISIICATIGAAQVENNKHIEKMERIKTCQEEEDERL